MASIWLPRSCATTGASGRDYMSEQRVREDKILTDLTTLKTLAGLARSPAEADSPKQPSQKLR